MKKAKTGLNKIQEIVQLLEKLKDKREKLIEHCRGNTGVNVKLLELLFKEMDEGKSVAEFAEVEELRGTIRSEIGSDSVLRNLHSKIHEFVGELQKGIPDPNESALEVMRQMEWLVEHQLKAQAEMLLLDLYKSIERDTLTNERNLYLAIKLLNWSHYFIYRSSKHSERHKEFLVEKEVRYYDWIAQIAKSSLMHDSMVYFTDYTQEELELILQHKSFAYFEFLYFFGIRRKINADKVKAIDTLLKNFNGFVYKKPLEKRDKLANLTDHKDFMACYYAFLKMEKFMAELLDSNDHNGFYEPIQVLRSFEFELNDLTRRNAAGLFGVFTHFQQLVHTHLASMAAVPDPEQFVQQWYFTKATMAETALRIEVNQWMYDLLVSAGARENVQQLLETISQKKIKGESVVQLYLKVLDFLANITLGHQGELKSKLKSCIYAMKYDPATPAALKDWLTQMEEIASADSSSKRKAGYSQFIPELEKAAAAHPMKFFLLNWMKMEVERIKR